MNAVEEEVSRNTNAVIGKIPRFQVSKWSDRIIRMGTDLST